MCTSVSLLVCLLLGWFVSLFKESCIKVLKDGFISKSSNKRKCIWKGFWDIKKKKEKNGFIRYSLSQTVLRADWLFTDYIDLIRYGW